MEEIEVDDADVDDTDLELEASEIDENDIEVTDLEFDDVSDVSEEVREDRLLGTELCFSDAEVGREELLPD